MLGSISSGSATLARRHRPRPSKVRKYGMDFARTKKLLRNFDKDDEVRTGFRSAVEVETRVAVLWSLLERHRRKYISRVGSTADVHVDAGLSQSVAPVFCSIHSIKQVIHGNLTVQDLWERQSKHSFTVYTSPICSETEMLKMIRRTLSG